LVKALGTSSRTEANRLAISVIAQIEEDFRLAERGEYPRISDTRLEEIAIDWWRWLIGRDGRLDAIHRGDLKRAALLDENDLTGSVRSYLGTTPTGISPGMVAYERLIIACTIIHHAELGGFAQDHNTILEARKRLDDQLEGGRLNPKSLLSFLAGKAPRNAVEAHPVVDLAEEAPTAPKKPKPPRSGPLGFKDLLVAYLRENTVTKKTAYDYERCLEGLRTHLGHDDINRVTPGDIIAWKDTLLTGTDEMKPLNPKTVGNRLIVLNAVWGWAEKNHRIGKNPAAGITVRIKKNRRTGIRGFTDEEAKRILLAARQDTRDHVRWVPWVASLTGARLEEIAGAHTRDIEQIEGQWVIHIRLDHRGEGASIKNDESERTIPIHSRLVEEGFVEYVQTLPDGPLFPKVTPDKFGSRGGNATKGISNWVRHEVGITDKRIKPTHSWRHRFKSISREAGIPEEIHDAITGHTNGSVSRDYGSVTIAAMAQAIEKLRSPV
jgi:integrase